MYWAKDYLLAGLDTRMRSSEKNRWTDGEKLDALNHGIAFLDGRVGFYVTREPTVDGNGLFQPPDYMRDQVLVYVNGVLATYPYRAGDTLPANAEIQGWVYNPSVYGNGTIVDSLDSDGTEVTIDTVSDVWIGDVGHIQIGLEVIRYNGVERLTSSTFKLQNLERNKNGSGALNHLAGAAFEFAIYGDNNFILQIIYSKASEYLHQLYITDGSATEIDHHNWAMRWNNQQANNFWRTYVPSKRYVQRPMRRKY